MGFRLTLPNRLERISIALQPKFRTPPSICEEFLSEMPRGKLTIGRSTTKRAQIRLYARSLSTSSFLSVNGGFPSRRRGSILSIHVFAISSSMKDQQTTRDG
ncbi:hypothetical protein CC78DRAFT_152123 [Lojkania enalia]|uniref:Uncharacterized protein n=1 Tax=Lojkania enalia TaxID=147567 RepID=A0A9P4KGZ9_9PLEO|nr:hypothetical protein CC78DRAFT_152123 [Didymosphaeria enalia]